MDRQYAGEVLVVCPEQMFVLRHRRVWDALAGGQIHREWQVLDSGYAISQRLDLEREFLDFEDYRSEFRARVTGGISVSRATWIGEVLSSQWYCVSVRDPDTRLTSNVLKIKRKLENVDRKR
jgi:hypothetical protein